MVYSTLERSLILNPAHEQEQEKAFHILMSLSHVEKFETTREEVLRRIFQGLSSAPSSVVIAKERAEDGSFHYHVGILVYSQRMYPLVIRKLFRQIFSEFDGMALDISLRRGCGPVCSYLTKQDLSPLVYGKQSLTEILRIAIASSRKRSLDSFRNLELTETLRSLSHFKEVADSPDLFRRMEGSVSFYRDAFALVKTREKQKRPSPDL